MMTKNLPLPRRYAGGYVYGDRRTGVLVIDEQENGIVEYLLPMEVITPKGKPDLNAVEEALAELAMAPIGARYEVTRECRPEEEEATETWLYRKTGPNEWVLVA